MGKIAVLLYLWCATIFYLSSAELSADQVYDILSSKLDNVNFDIKNLRTDIKDISERAGPIGQAPDVDNITELKKMLDTFKNEMNSKFASLEEKLTHKVEKNVNVLSKHESVKHNMVLNRHALNIGKTLSSEKMLIRRKFQEVEQSIDQRNKEAEDRIIEVEQKMQTFENASWKGDRGDVGPSRPPGIKGIKGDKGDRGVGLKGQKGEKGNTGLTGIKGQKGSAETRNTAYFTVSLRRYQSLPQKTVIKFDVIFTNEGKGYDSSTGKFTAPASGVYLFLFFAKPGKDKNEKAYIQLYVDGYYRAYVFQETHHDDHDTMAGQAYVTFMSAGSQAWLQTGVLTSKSLYIKLASYGTTFTGIFLN